ncbi:MULTISPECIES: RNA polymerase sigma factor [unclassified Streptomyces]|uniref:RNA polymerase sigma factor n=1 Tax=unclassified Streptomyces TaxID=2593676 RepID=UPI003817B6AB
MRDRIRAGNREAFAEFYEEHSRGVYNHAYRLTGNWSTAEEVMSDTFLEAWRTREEIEPQGGSLRPWLLGVATNKARNANRRVRRRIAFLTRRQGLDEVIDFADESASRIDGSRELDAVRQALTQLRRPEREVLALCVWADLDYAEAGQALGIPVGTVRSRLSRARAQLRKLTDEQLSGRCERTRSAGATVQPTAAPPALTVQEASR